MATSTLSGPARLVQFRLRLLLIFLTLVTALIGAWMAWPQGTRIIATAAAIGGMIGAVTSRLTVALVRLARFVASKQSAAPETTQRRELAAPAIRASLLRSLAESAWLWLLLGWFGAAAAAAGNQVAFWGWRKQAGAMATEPIWLSALFWQGALCSFAICLAYGCFRQARGEFRIPVAVAWTLFLCLIHMAAWAPTMLYLTIWALAASGGRTY